MTIEVIAEPWFVGETATPFERVMRDADGVARTDIASATFTLVNAATDDVLIDHQACQSVAGGVLSYRPTALQMATACRFRAQFVATLTGTGYVLPTAQFSGEIAESL